MSSVTKAPHSKKHKIQPIAMAGLMLGGAALLGGTFALIHVINKNNAANNAIAVKKNELVIATHSKGYKITNNSTKTFTALGKVTLKPAATVTVDYPKYTVTWTSDDNSVVITLQNAAMNDVDVVVSDNSIPVVSKTINVNMFPSTVSLTPP